MISGKRIGLGRNGKMFLMTGVALVGVLASAGVLHAGYKVPPTSWEISLSGTTTGNFQGSAGAARASSDGYQYIGCELDWIGPNSSTTATVEPLNYGYCYARDRNGNTKGCYVTIKYGTASALLGAMNQDSYISVNYFSMPDAAYCGSIWVGNYSYNPVKTN